MAIQARVKTKLIPNRLIFKKGVKTITDVHPKFIVNEYIIEYGEGNLLSRVLLVDAHHPNCNPKTKEFCLPDNLKCKESDPSLIPIIESLIRTFNFESSYYQPWNEFEYEE